MPHAHTQRHRSHRMLTRVSFPSARSADISSRPLHMWSHCGFFLGWPVVTWEEGVYCCESFPAGVIKLETGSSHRRHIRLSVIALHLFLKRDAPPPAAATNPWLSSSPLDLRLSAGLRTLSRASCLQTFPLSFFWKQIFCAFSVFLSW